MRRLLLALSAAALVLQGCNRTDAAAAKAPPAAPVTVATAQARDITLELNAVGHVEAHRTVNVTSRVDGQIVAVHFKEGDEVAAGAALFQLDPRPFQAQLDSALAKAAQDRAQHENARRTDERNLELIAKNFISPQAAEAARTTTRTLEAALAGDRAAIDAARLNLEYATIRAPIAGRTGRILVQQGNLARANDTASLVSINQVAPVYVSFAVPERYAGQILSLQSQRPLRVSVKAQDGAAAQGSLTLIDNTVDATTGTVTLRASFENADRRLWPGQFVNTKLVLSQQAGAIVVPEAALQAGPTGRYVWVVKDDATAEQRAVSVDRVQEGQAVIANGLAAGEKVVLSGALRLAPATRVQIVDSSRAP